MKRVYYRYFTCIWQEQKDLLSFVSMEVASLGEPFSFKDWILVALEFDELCYYGFTFEKDRHTHCNSFICVCFFLSGSRFL